MSVPNGANETVRRETSCIVPPMQANWLAVLPWLDGKGRVLLTPIPLSTTKKHLHLWLRRFVPASPVFLFVSLSFYTPISPSPRAMSLSLPH